MTTTSRLTYADLAETPDDGNRYELFDGELIVTPAPARNHQWVVSRIVTALAPAAGAVECEVLVAPVDFVLGDDDTTLQPDVVVLTAAQTAEGAAGGPYREPPLLAIEVLSPSNRGRDLRVKRSLYARFGFPYLWFVDPDGLWIVAEELAVADYRAAGRHEGRTGTFAAPPFPAFDLDMASLWRGLP